MKVAILGSGATGSAFAAYMKLGGIDDIWLIDLNRAHWTQCATTASSSRTTTASASSPVSTRRIRPEEVGLCDILHRPCKVHAHQERNAGCHVLYR